MSVLDFDAGVWVCSGVIENVHITKLKLHTGICWHHVSLFISIDYLKGKLNFMLFVSAFTLTDTNRCDV